MKTKILTLVITLGFICSVFASLVPEANATGNHTLTIQYGSIDGGSVQINTLGQTCGSNCTKSIADGTTVKLTIVSNSGYLTYGFSNGVTNAVECDEGGYSAVCTFVMDKDLTAKPLWIYSSVNIVVSKKGTGSGTVTGSGINCGSDCTGSYGTKIPPGPTADPVSLTAKAASGSKFVGWDTSGDICYSGGGKGGAAAINTSSTATCYISGYQKTYKAVPIFNSTSSSNSSGSTSTSNESSGSDSDESEPEAATSEEPALKSLSNLTLNGQKFDPNKPPDQKMEFNENEPINFSGKTVANGVVTLYVFSEPKKYTVTADRNGAWNVSVEGLPAGNHHAEIEVTDPKTKETSRRSKLLEFTVLSAIAPVPSVQVGSVVSAKSTNAGLIIAGVVGGLIILASASLAAIARFKPELWTKIKSKFHKHPPVSPESLA